MRIEAKPSTPATGKMSEMAALQKQLFSIQKQLSKLNDQLATTADRDARQLIQQQIRALEQQISMLEEQMTRLAMPVDKNQNRPHLATPQSGTANVFNGGLLNVRV